MACDRLHLLLHLSALFVMSLIQIAGLEIAPNRISETKKQTVEHWLLLCWLTGVMAVCLSGWRLVVYVLAD